MADNNDRSITVKADAMRLCADKTIASFRDEGRHLIAYQIERAFADVPERSLARLYDIIKEL